SDRRGLRPALLLRSSGFVSVTLSMSTRKSSHRTIFLIVSSGSPLALIASSLRSTSKKPVCPMTRSLHPPMAHCRQRVRLAAAFREEFFKGPWCQCSRNPVVAYHVSQIIRGLEALMKSLSFLAPRGSDRNALFAHYAE